MSIDAACMFPAPDRKYGPRALALVARIREKRVPLGGSIELTHRCNLACVHCYVNEPAADRQAQRREMTTEQIYKILDELAELGTLSLTLTGGEPTLRKDFADIYRYAHQKGFLVTVYTNATLVTDRLLDLWREYPPALIDITQYGFSAETYDRVAAAGDGQYARFRVGLERLLTAGLNVSLKTMVMRSNVHEVRQIREFARSLGVEFRQDSVLSPRIDGGKGPLAERLTGEEIAAVDTDDEKFRKGWEDFCTQHTGFTPGNDNLYQCGAGSNTFLIDPYGRMHTCELSRTLAWDVVNNGFARGWYEGVPALLTKKRVHDNNCGSCSTYGACSYCVGMAELEGKNPADGNTYFCEMTDARNARLLGAERPTPNGLVQLRKRQQVLAEKTLGDQA